MDGFKVANQLILKQISLGNLGGPSVITVLKSGRGSQMIQGKRFQGESKVRVTRREKDSTGCCQL